MNARQSGSLSSGQTTSRYCKGRATTAIEMNLKKTDNCQCRRLLDWAKERGRRPFNSGRKQKGKPRERLSFLTLTMTRRQDQTPRLGSLAYRSTRHAKAQKDQMLTPRDRDRDPWKSARPIRECRSSHKKLAEIQIPKTGPHQERHFYKEQTGTFNSDMT